MLTYTLLGAISSLLSAVGTAVILIKLRRHWDLHVSSVRWLFFMFFLYLFLWALTRTISFVWMLSIPHARQLHFGTEEAPTTMKELDALGVHSIPISTLANNGYLAVLIILGNVFLLGVAFWMMALTYELAKIAIMSMDRGPVLEAKRIRLYNWCIHTLIMAYTTVHGTIAILERGYTESTYKWLRVNYVVQILSIVYMVGTLLVLKIRGRKYEATHGTFTPSPVYQRMKRIIIVYALFATQFQVATLVLGASESYRRDILDFVGITMVLFQSTGFALSIITGCSQTCVLHACRTCIPEDLEAQYLQHKFGVVSAAQVEPLEPPHQDPVFVYTDIQASTALWALADDGIMETATNLHDNIMRSSLPRHRGYEITTSGDSFQLAFQTIEDAVAFCVDVQLQLLVAPWPKELHGVLPATKRQRSGHRLVFNGLRVRMGVHDSVEDDGVLVCSRHAITNRMTYMGASRSIASDVSELGRGGQILVTQRVAKWVHDHTSDLDVDLVVTRWGRFHLDPLDHSYGVFELTPTVLVGRRKCWRNDSDTTDGSTTSPQQPTRSPSTAPTSTRALLFPDTQQQSRRPRASRRGTRMSISPPTWSRSTELTTGSTSTRSLSQETTIESPRTMVADGNHCIDEELIGVTYTRL